MEVVNLPMSLRDLSHELRTPLTGILGMAYFLSQGTLTAEQQDYVKDICQSSEKLLTVVNQLLAESKRLKKRDDK